MDTALPQKFPFILDRNLEKAICTGNRVCTSCDTVVLDCGVNFGQLAKETHQSKCKTGTRSMLGMGMETDVEFHGTESKSFIKKLRKLVF